MCLIVKVADGNKHEAAAPRHLLDTGGRVKHPSNAEATQRQKEETAKEQEKTNSFGSYLN